MPELAAARLPSVLVVQRRLPHYRMAFFEALRTALAERGFTLNLAVGDATPAEASRSDAGHLPWALPAPCRYWLGGRLCWQRALPWVRQADLVVLTQENKLLLNWWLLMWRRSRPRVALWGHGRDFQTRSRFSGLMHRLKAWLSRRADWWFAYTAMSARTVHDFGFDNERITTLNNAVDTLALRRSVHSARKSGRAAVRATLCLGNGPLGLYLGSLYTDKKVDMLLLAARNVRARLPDFELVVAGAGPEQQALQASAVAQPWIHFVGQAQGDLKQRLLASADVMLCPGAAGLGVVESFAAGLPLVVGNTHNHGPEIEYLRHGENGMFAPATPSAYAQAVVELLTDPALMAKLRQGCDSSAEQYTQEAMVQHFCEGVQRWYGSGVRTIAAAAP